MTIHRAVLRHEPNSDNGLQFGSACGGTPPTVFELVHVSVFRCLPRQAQCWSCFLVGDQLSATAEHIAAVEIGLTVLARDQRPWRDADEHGGPNGNNPHVWLPLGGMVLHGALGSSNNPGPSGISKRQCPCGLYEHEWKFKQRLLGFIEHRVDSNLYWGQSGPIATGRLGALGVELSMGRELTERLTRGPMLGGRPASEWSRDLLGFGIGVRPGSKD